MDTSLKLSRKSPFSFTCTACGKCCYSKKIQLNPYEIARMASHLGIGTGEFLSRYVEPETPFLKRREDDACIFLSTDGCTVYPARPLACRLYPLGLHISGDGQAHFSCMPLPGECQASGSGPETVTDFLAANEAGPSLQAAEDYLELYYDFYRTLVKRFEQDAHIDEPPEHEGHAPLLQEWFDVDSLVESYCQESGISVPEDLEEKSSLHIEALKRRINDIAEAKR